jgi:cytochrome c oxidase subunit IV
MNTKTEQQKLFDDIRHLISSKHQVPSYLTVWELNFILETLKNAPEGRG